MSQLKIKKAFEEYLDGLQPPIETTYDNVNFKPTADVPYQFVSILFAKPENPSLGDDFYRERGYLQVSLKYPQNIGAGDAMARGELIRGWFKRGLSLEEGGVTAIVEETPEIRPGNNEGDRYVVNVFVRFFSNIEG